MKLQSTLFNIILLLTYLSLTSAADVSDTASSHGATLKRPFRSLSRALGKAFKFPKLSETPKGNSQSHWLTRLFFPRRSSRDSNTSEVSSSTHPKVPTESEDTSSDEVSDQVDFTTQYENDNIQLRYSPITDPLDLEMAAELEEYTFPDYPMDAEQSTKESQSEQIYDTHSIVDSIVPDEESSNDDAKYHEESKTKGLEENFESSSSHTVQPIEQTESVSLIPVTATQQVPEQVIPKEVAVELPQVVPVDRTTVVENIAVIQNVPVKVQPVVQSSNSKTLSSLTELQRDVSDNIKMLPSKRITNNSHIARLLHRALNYYQTVDPAIYRNLGSQHNVILLTSVLEIMDDLSHRRQFVRPHSFAFHILNRALQRYSNMKK